MAIIDKVKTIVLLMFENRSFDHMLGHLSLESINRNVDGFKKPMSQYDNHYKGDSYSVFNFRNDVQLPFDLPHEFDFVDIQLARSSVSQRFTMRGFVEAYAKFTNEIPNPQAEPMGYFNSYQVPISSFLARTYCVCDKWFCSLPTGTQPNRTMAFSGDSPIHKNGLALKINNNNIFSWLTRNKIRWRVYHDGLSGFILYPALWKYVLSNNFRDFEYLTSDIIEEPESKAPQVIIIEPSYSDAPHVGSDRPNDNHPPLAIGWGEEFLRRTYEAISSNKQKWKSTVMMVYYDEHGGFYDHVPPPKVRYKTIGSDNYQFESLGPRIPGLILSPFVQQASICSNLLDHTSVLQFLAEKFTPGVDYCDTIKNRKQQGITSISAALTNADGWEPPMPPSDPIIVSTALGKSIAHVRKEILPQAFEKAALNLITKNRAKVQEKYPELLLWKKAVENARS